MTPDVFGSGSHNFPHRSGSLPLMLGLKPSGGLLSSSELRNLLCSERKPAEEEGGRKSGTFGPGPNPVGLPRESACTEGSGLLGLVFYLRSKLFRCNRWVNSNSLHTCEHKRVMFSIVPQDSEL